MKILVIGNGGREHALSWKLAQSIRVKKVYVAPGNAGTSLENKLENINLTTTPELIQFAKMNQIDFTLVGPEAPLANGIVDEFRKNNLKIWGPTQFCAQLESSKAYAKDFMQKFNIPTARYKIFDNPIDSIKYLETQEIPIVIKADGLAAGKGVLVANNKIEAKKFINEIFYEDKFGGAGSKVVIEECLNGIEASFITMIDGDNILVMASSQDHKRLLDGDNGPNTGGMGAYSPAPIITKELENRVIKEIIQPVINGMKSLGHKYTGFLYAGIMIDQFGNPKNLEFNCRFGDPETQPIICRLESDLVDLIESGLNGDLDQITAKWADKYAVGVILASHGYPETPRKNDVINGLENISLIPDIKIFHSATLIDKNQIITNGGRVLCLVALDRDLNNAKNKAYTAIKDINFNGMQYRHDISNKAFTK